MKTKGKSSDIIILKSKSKVFTDRSVSEQSLVVPDIEKRLIRKLALIVALIGSFLYVNTINHGFVLDDYSLIVENKTTQKGIEGVKEIFKTSYRQGWEMKRDDLYRPVSKAMFALEWAMKPGSPKPGHIINVLLYCLTGFFLMTTLFNYFKSSLLSFIISILFIAHPIHTEVVANIKSRDEILAFLFTILAMNSSYRYLALGKLNSLLISLFFFLIAMFSKESAIVFPAIFLLTGFFFFPGKLKQVFIALSGYLTVIIFFLVVRQSVLGTMTGVKLSIIENSIVAAPDMVHRIATAIYVLGLYLKLLVYPHPLVFNYSYNSIPIVSINDWRFIVPGVVLVFIFLGSLFFIKKKTEWAFGILFFFISISVVSNIFFLIGTEMGERLMYSSSLGFCIVLGYFLQKPFHSEINYTTLKEFFFRYGKQHVLVLIVLLLYAVKTIARNHDWKDNFTLFSHDIKWAEHSSRAHFSLGNVLCNEEQKNAKDAEDKAALFATGIAELEKAIQIYPNYADARNNLGIAYYNTNKFDEALKIFLESLANNAEQPVVNNHIGLSLIVLNREAEAEEYFRNAIRLKPNYFDAYINLANVLNNVNKTEEAVRLLDRAMEIFPRSAVLIDLRESILHPS